MGMSAGEAPAIPAWSNYGKRPNEYRTGEDVGLAPGVLENEIPPTVKFEGPDPSYWCRNGYALININIRGVGYSDGYHDQFGIQDGKDGVAPCRFGALPVRRLAGSKEKWLRVHREFERSDCWFDCAFSPRTPSSPVA